MFGHRPYYPRHHAAGLNPIMVGGPMAYPAVGYQELVGQALDELDALDMHHTAGAYPALGAVGLQELVGADPFTQLMAAGADPTALQQLASQMQTARAIDPNAVVVRERQEDARRSFTLGFDAGADTAAGIQGNATQQPQVTFRPERLTVPSYLAPFFTIDNIIVGKDSQTAVGNNPVPATTYSEVAVGVRLLMKTANLGHLVTLVFTNVDTDPHRFRAAIVGTATDVG